MQKVDAEHVVLSGAQEGHGKFWEKELLKLRYKAEPGKQTDKHDLVAEKNNIDGVNVSIKTT